MTSRTEQKIEYGDFQTPAVLAREVCKVLRNLGIDPRLILEPTCGKGSFLQAAVHAFPACKKVLGYEIRPEYVQMARSIEGAAVFCQDFFQKDWLSTFRDLQEPALIIGNPPWVTNSALGTLGGSNLPQKSNFRGLNGLEAKMGKSNFDISEWMLIHLLECLSGREAALAMLCKTGVARKVLHHAWGQNLEMEDSRMYLIDAVKHFNASVDACLLVCILKPGGRSKECTVFSDLGTSPEAQSTVAFRDGRLVADLASYKSHGHILGESPLKWRSGVKHDCSRIMELVRTDAGEFRNGLGEVVALESTNLYPMLKSSDLLRGSPTPSRYMLVTQCAVGEDTSRLQRESPRTWEYLQSHSKLLDSRRSSIYKNRPRFSVFGVGPYSFTPWKVAISGFAKRLDFHCIGPYRQKPVVVDDTCYFLPCKTKEEAGLLTKLLNSPAARSFFHAFIFWDAKRPITAQLLAALDFGVLGKEVGVESIPAWLRSERGQMKFL
ncbi:MAG: SAM-dependent DNA methyltransferase [Holophagales bacterium]|nr:SAM-dependent DNA methyltransferase [Holophagales bacterium]